MKTLRTLSKLHKRRLDALRQAISDLEQQKEQLVVALQRLAQEMQCEVDLASKQVGMSRFFGDYAKRIQTRQAHINLEIKTLTASMDLLREKMAEEFGEMKKYDITRDNRLKKKTEEENRKERERLDEVALQGFSRAGSKPSP